MSKETVTGSRETVSKKNGPSAELSSEQPTQDKAHSPPNLITMRPEPAGQPQHNQNQGSPRHPDTKKPSPQSKKLSCEKVAVKKASPKKRSAEANSKESAEKASCEKTSAEQVMSQKKTSVEDHHTSRRAARADRRTQSLASENEKRLTPSKEKQNAIEKQNNPHKISRKVVDLDRKPEKRQRGSMEHRKTSKSCEDARPPKDCKKSPSKTKRLRSREDSKDDSFESTQSMHKANVAPSPMHHSSEMWVEQKFLNCGRFTVSPKCF